MTIPKPKLEGISEGYYNFLNQSGMLWEEYPEATGIWALDTKKDSVYTEKNNKDSQK